MVKEQLEAPPTLPNLRPQAPSYVDIAPDLVEVDPVGLVRLPNGPLVLRFTTRASNVGAYALDLLGTPTADPLRWEALQCSSWVEGRICRARRSAGALVWHPQHNHFHFEDFARYELRTLQADGAPDFSAGGLIASSPKVSFCLQDTSRDNPDAPPFYLGCAGAVQGISPGWSDVYDAGLPGQSLPIAGVADGRYALILTLDPDNRLAESDDADNTAWSVVEISNDGTHAEVVSR